MLGYAIPGYDKLMNLSLSLYIYISLSLYIYIYTHTHNTPRNSWRPNAHGLADHQHDVAEHAASGSGLSLSLCPLYHYS